MKEAARAILFARFPLSAPRPPVSPLHPPPFPGWSLHAAANTFSDEEVATITPAPLCAVLRPYVLLPTILLSKTCTVCLLHCWLVNNNNGAALRYSDPLVRIDSFVPPPASRHRHPPPSVKSVSKLSSPRHPFLAVRTCLMIKLLGFFPWILT